MCSSCCPAGACCCLCLLLWLCSLIKLCNSHHYRHLRGLYSTLHLRNHKPSSESGTAAASAWQLSCLSSASCQVSAMPAAGKAVYCDTLLLTPCRRTPVAPQITCFVGFFWVCSTSLPPADINRAIPGLNHNRWLRVTCNRLDLLRVNQTDAIHCAAGHRDLPGSQCQPANTGEHVTDHQNLPGVFTTLVLLDLVA